MGTFLGTTDGLKSILGVRNLRMKNVFFESFGTFFELWKPLGIILDHLGNFDFRRCSLIFVGCGRVSSVGGEKS